MNTKDKLMEKMERRDKLMKLFYAVHRSQILPIDAIEEIEALLTSEVEKARKEKQKEQEWLLDYQKNQILEEVIGEDEGEKLFTTSYGECNECLAGEGALHTADCYWHQKIVRNKLRKEQRKALSELQVKK